MIALHDDHPRPAGIRRIGLVTADADGAYAALGFHAPSWPDRCMKRPSRDAPAPLGHAA